MSMNILRTTHSIARLPQIFTTSTVHGTTRTVGTFALQQGEARRSFLTTAHWNSPTKETSKGSTNRKKVATKKPAAKKSTKTYTGPTAKSKKTVEAEVVEKENKPPSKTQIMLQERAKRKEEKAARKALEEYKPPRHAPNAYAFFAAQFFKAATLPEVTPTSVRLTLAAQAWNRLSKEERRPYEQLYEAAKAEHAVKYNEWLKTIEAPTLLLVNRRRRKAGMRLIGRPSSVKPRPLSPFFRFLHEFRARYVTEHGVDGKLTMEGNRSVNRLAGEAWRALPEEDKNSYKDAFKVEHAKTLASRQK